LTRAPLRQCDRSAGDDDLHPRGAPRHVDCNVIDVPPEEEIDLGIAETKPVQMELVERPGQARVVQPHLLVLGVEGDAKTGAKQPQDRGARPGLRVAGDGVEGRADPLAPWEAAEQFR